MRRSEERKKQKRKKLAVVLAVCLAGFCASGYMVISQLVREKRDEAAFTALRELASWVVYLITAGMICLPAISIMVRASMLITLE